MSSDSDIKHRGKIKSIKDGVLKVSIMSYSACASCHAKAGCSVADMDEKIIEISNFDQQFVAGEQVNVFYKERQGFKALFLGYVFPFILVFATLVITLYVSENEAIAGISSIGLLIPYYLILFLTKDKLKQSFNFEIEKIKPKHYIKPNSNN